MVKNVGYVLRYAGEIRTVVHKPFQDARVSVVIRWVTQSLFIHDFTVSFALVLNSLQLSFVSLIFRLENYFQWTGRICYASSMRLRGINYKTFTIE